MAFRSNASCFLILTSNTLPIRHKPPQHISVPSLLQHADNEQKAPERSLPTRNGHDQHQEQHEDQDQNENHGHPTGIPSDHAQGPGTSHGTPHSGTETRDPPPRASPRPWTRQHPEQEAPPRSHNWNSLPKPLSGTSFGKVGALF